MENKKNGIFISVEVQKIDMDAKKRAFSAKFATVEFQSDNGDHTCDIVPVRWLRHPSDDYTESYWPPFTNPTKVSKFVQQCEEPAASWLKYPVRILKKYGKAFIVVKDIKRHKLCCFIGCILMFVLGTFTGIFH